ncbi:nucleotidyltransferase domain-containing protein [Thioalkalivibrio sp. ALMg11]|uniref:type VII toxin-antitoxin system MntA family adenylyltransferase antitoxin n=1 Tax=Thioalkalivibrio sp. ALMg11 TaxID=1158165 RepID=UPI00037CD9E6|nr:nucleotidyltransferase domain-containing protein [Thioalkalivibrio sp. ALMg11]
MTASTDIDRIRATVQRHDELELAILFGSLARGTAGPDSDVDLAVSARGPLSADARITLIEELAAATGRPVDLVDLARAGEPLLGEIVTSGVRLTGSDEAHARFLTRHLIEQADFLPYRDRILAERRKSWIGG